MDHDVVAVKDASVVAKEEAAGEKPASEPNSPIDKNNKSNSPDEEFASTTFCARTCLPQTNVPHQSFPRKNIQETTPKDTPQGATHQEETSQENPHEATHQGRTLQGEARKMSSSPETCSPSRNLSPSSPPSTSTPSTSTPSTSTPSTSTPSTSPPPSYTLSKAQHSALAKAALAKSGVLGSLAHSRHATMAPVAKPDSNTAASAEKMSDAKATEAKGKGKASQAYEPKDGTPQEGPAPEKPTKADVSPAKLGLLFSSKYATAEPVLDIMERRKHPSQPHSRRGKRNLPGGNETGPSKDSESKKSPKTQKSLDSKDAKEQKQELGKQREPKKQDPENKPAELDLKPTKWSDMIDDDDYESEAELIKIANSLWKNGDGRSTSESSPNSKTSSKTKDTASTTKPPTESINATEAEEGAASTPDAVLKSKDETVAEGASTTAPAKPFGLMGSKWSTDHIPNAESEGEREGCGGQGIPTSQWWKEETWRPEQRAVAARPLQSQNHDEEFGDQGPFVLSVDGYFLSGKGPREHGFGESRTD